MKRPPRTVWLVLSSKLYTWSSWKTRREALRVCKARNRQYGEDCEFRVAGPYTLAERVREK